MDTKRFRKHSCHANPSQLFARQIQARPFLCQRPVWTQPAGGDLSCQGPGSWRALTALLCTERGHPRPHPQSQTWAVAGLKMFQRILRKDLCSTCSVVPLCLLIVMFIWCKILFWRNAQLAKKKTSRIKQIFSHLLYQLFMSHPFCLLIFLHLFSSLKNKLS